jgi:hypothetical protein
VPLAVGGVLVALVVVLGAVSCTTSQWDTSAVDDPSSTTAKVYPLDEAGIIASLTDHLSAVGDNLNEWAPPRDQARCAGERIVHRLGSDRLLDLGYDPQRGKLDLQYTDDERIAMANMLDSCIDVAAGLNSMFAGYGKLGVEASTCLTDGIERRGLARDFISGILTGTSADPFAEDHQLGTGMSRLMIECLTPAEDLLPVAPVSPFPQDIGSTTTTAPSTNATTGDS